MFFRGPDIGGFVTFCLVSTKPQKMSYFFKIGHKLFRKKWGKKPQISVVVWDFTCITGIQPQTQFS